MGDIGFSINFGINVWEQLEILEKLGIMAAVTLYFIKKTGI